MLRWKWTNLLLDILYFRRYSSSFWSWFGRDYPDIYSVWTLVLNIYCSAKATIFRGIYTVAGNSVCPKHLSSSESLTEPFFQLSVYTYSVSALHLWFSLASHFKFSCLAWQFETKESRGSEGCSVPNDERN